MLERALGLLGLILCPECAAIEVWTKEVDMATGVLVRPTTWITSCRYSGGGVAVIATVEREHLVLTGVQASHTNRVFDSICATIGEEDLVHMRCGALCNQLGSLCARIICMLRSDSCEFGSLILNRFNDLGMLEADVGEYQLAGEIQVLVALVIPEVTTFSPSHRHWADLGLGRPRVENVSAIKVKDLFTAGRLG